MKFLPYSITSTSRTCIDEPAIGPMASNLNVGISELTRTHERQTYLAARMHLCAYIKCRSSPRTNCKSLHAQRPITPRIIHMYTESSCEHVRCAVWCLHACMRHELWRENLLQTEQGFRANVMNLENERSLRGKVVSEMWYIFCKPIMINNYFKIARP